MTKDEKENVVEEKMKKEPGREGNREEGNEKRNSHK